MARLGCKDGFLRVPVRFTLQTFQLDNRMQPLLEDQATQL